MQGKAFARLKKLTQKQQLINALEEITHKDISLLEMYNEWQSFKANQTIYKKLPRGIDDKLWENIALAMAHKYIAQNEVPKSMLAYISLMYKKLREFRDRWNELKLQPYISDNDLYIPERTVRRELKAKYASTYPEMMEASALMEASTRLKKSGVTCDELDARIRRLTNDFDVEIIARLPIVEYAMAKKSFDSGYYAFDPYGVYVYGV